jgi:multidrug efflux pump subunit AcrA (membrane-fusion protein)
LRSLKLEAGVSELEAGRLRTGMPARITVQARPGEVFQGRLAAIAPEVDPRNRHFTIEVRTTNPGSLLAGMYATATIPTEHVSDAVAVPRDAITTRGSRRVALKVEAGACPRSRSHRGRFKRVASRDFKRPEERRRHHRRRAP